MKKIIFLLIIILGIYFGYSYYKKNSEPVKEKFVYEDILNDINDKKVMVDTFTIYGKYLNIKGDLPNEEGTYTLVLKNNTQEETISTDINEKRFSTSKYINDGINLEKLKEGNYLILLHNIDTNSYYNLINKTNYHDNKYYTITRNKKNNLITFNEEKFNEINYLELKVKEESLPPDVYDIVIDPGHGGVDTGAGNGKYHESKFTLDYGKTLKEELEKYGLKVKLTREEDVQIKHYGVGSRTGIPYEVKAKLMLSIHLNSSGSSKQKGVEIYRAYQDNNDFAKVLADNIKAEADTVYSNNSQNKILDGVYMRKYSKSDIASFIKDAKKKGYEPYDFTDDLTYYYFIRETGGIMTKAFSDGRNPKYKEPNPYRNDNQGVEAYLCELAYISQSDDLKKVINNKEGFIKGLVKSVLTYSEITQNSDTNN